MTRHTVHALAFILIFSFLAFDSSAQVITTVAGSAASFRGAPGPATGVSLGLIRGVAVDAAANVFMADNANHLVVKVTPSGLLTVVAGNGIPGFSGDGGPATSARLNLPEGLALDTAGNLYIGDSGNVRVRKVSPDGTITTVVGNGGYGYSGDGGPATSATLSAFGLALDSAGNLYIADRDNRRIRKVSGGIITTVAGNGVLGFSGDGGPALSASLNVPLGVAVDSAGNVYIADYGNNRVRKVGPAGTITTVAGGGTNNQNGIPATSAILYTPSGVAVDSAGNLYIAEPNVSNGIRKVDTAGKINTVAGGGRGFCCDGGPATSALLNGPIAVAVDTAGNLYVADTGNGRLRKVGTDGIINTLAGSGLRFSGDGGPATSALLNAPAGVALDTAGNLYIGDGSNSRVRRVTAGGIITTIAGTGALRFAGDGGPATSASFNTVSDVAVDASGNVYVVDFGSKAVRRFTPGGTITSVAGDGVLSYCGPYLPGNNVLYSPGVGVDLAGNLYIADGPQHRVCKVSPSGTRTTVAGTGVAGFSGDGGPATSASLNAPADVAVDAALNLYIADRGNNRIRKVSPGGTITTFAGNGSSGSTGDGGPATSASLSSPWSLALDAAGNLYIGEGQRVRRVSAGTITTVAGSGSVGFSGDGGPATSASFRLFNQTGLAVDASGNLYIGDSGNNRIRKVLATPPSFSVSPASLSFSAPAGSAGLTPQPIALRGSIVGLAWQAAVRTTSGGSWLTVSPASGQIPATVSVSVDATNLVAGTYQGTIEVSVPVAVPSLATVAVTFTVSSVEPPRLVAGPASLSFQVVAGGTAPAQSLRIENAGGGTLSWTAQAAAVTGNWLSVTPAAGSATASAPAALQVSVSAGNLARGSYSGSITVASATTNQSVTVPVNLLVSAPEGVLLLSQSSLLFRAVEAGGAEPPQTFGVLNVGTGTSSWTVQSTAGWVRVSPDNGSSDAGATQIPLVNVSVDSTALSAGFYVGMVQVSSSAANNSPQVVRVDLQVLPRGTTLGAVVRPTGLIFVGAAGGASPGSQEVRVATTESTPVEFLSEPIAGDWVTRNPESDTATRDKPGRIVVQPELGSLKPDVYRAGLSVFTKNDGEIHPVRLLFLVLPAGVATPSAFGDEAPAGGAQACTASKLLLQFASLFSSFNATVGWPTTVLLNARDDCGNPAVGGTVSLSFSSGEAAVALTDLKNGQYQGLWRPNSGVVPQVLVKARGFWQGLAGEVTATAQVSGNPNPQSAFLSQGGVLLGAGFERGPVAPGSIISLFGQKLAAGESFASTLPLPRTMGGVRVLISGKEAPLFYVGPGQVNTQVPTDLEAGRQLQVSVETNGVLSAPEPLQTAGNRPGIFTLGGTFGNQGAILIANTSLLAMPVTPNVPSEPVRAGGVISIYCTGLGTTDPAVASGQPGPTTEPLAVVKTPVAVSIGGQTAPVLFAGMAPGFAGVYQVNAQVPDGIAPGNAVPVVITQGGFQSNTATIAVQ